MFSNLNDFKGYIKNKKVAVIGVGISNKPLIKYIYNLGANITAFDIAEESDKYIKETKKEFKKNNILINWSLGKDYLKQLDGFDIIFKTPKMRIDNPELIKAQNDGALVTSEMEIFFECCPCDIIGITGSDGKTTTTTIISLILEEQGYTVHLGGNIGTPLIDRLDTIKRKDIAVIELSSFQLHSMIKSPKTAIITNITPNHLDVHKDFNEYIEAKMNIFKFQGEEDRLILNNEDPISSMFQNLTKSKILYFPGKRLQHKNKNYETWYDEYNFYIGRRNKIPIKNIPLSERYNLDNYCAAIIAVRPYVKNIAIIKVMKSFKGVKHRKEFLRTIDGVDYYNSSIDSSPARTKTTLDAFKEKGQNIVLITGGKDKKSDYSKLGEAILAVSKKIILCGENKEEIKEAINSAIKEKNIKDNTQIIEVQDYENALTKARSMAIAGEAVVLSPSGTSFDKFKNFEERGDYFKKLVEDI